MLSDPTNIAGNEIMQSSTQGDTSNIDGETMIGIPAEKKIAEVGDLDESGLEDEDKEAIQRRREEKGKGSEKDALKVRCRLSDSDGPDVVILLGESQSVGVLARRVHGEANVSDLHEKVLQMTLVTLMTDGVCCRY